MTNRAKKTSRKYQEIWPIVNLNRQTLRASKDIRKELSKLSKDDLMKLAKDTDLKNRSKMKKDMLIQELSFNIAARYAQAEVEASKPRWVA